MQWQSKRGKRLWATTSLRSRVLMFLAIFFTASALGVLLDVPRPIHLPVPYLAVNVALFGIMAVVFGLATVLDLRLMVVGIALNVIDGMVGKWATQAVGATPLSAAAEHRRLLGDTIASFACVVLGTSSSSASSTRWLDGTRSSMPK